MLFTSSSSNAIGSRQAGGDEIEPRTNYDVTFPEDSHIATFTFRYGSKGKIYNSKLCTERLIRDNRGLEAATRDTAHASAVARASSPASTTAYRL